MLFLNSFNIPTRALEKLALSGAQHHSYLPTGAALRLQPRSFKTQFLIQTPSNVMPMIYSDGHGTETQPVCLSSDAGSSLHTDSQSGRIDSQNLLRWSWRSTSPFHSNPHIQHNTFTCRSLHTFCTTHPQLPFNT